jgi:hypothetical protein
MNMTEAEIEIISIHRIFSVRYDDDKGREIEAEVLEEDDPELSIWDFKILDVKIDGVQDYEGEIDDDTIIELVQKYIGKEG